MLQCKYKFCCLSKGKKLKIAAWGSSSLHVNDIKLAAKNIIIYFKQEKH